MQPTNIHNGRLFCSDLPMLWSVSGESFPLLKSKQRREPIRFPIQVKDSSTGWFFFSDSSTIWSMGVGSFPILESIQRKETMINSVSIQVDDLRTGRLFWSDLPILWSVRGGSFPLLKSTLRQENMIKSLAIQVRDNFRVLWKCLKEIVKMFGVVTLMWNLHLDTVLEVNIQSYTLRNRWVSTRLIGQDNTLESLVSWHDWDTKEGCPAQESKQVYDQLLQSLSLRSRVLYNIIHINQINWLYQSSTLPTSPRFCEQDQTFSSSKIQRCSNIEGCVESKMFPNWVGGFLCSNLPCSTHSWG